MTLNMGDRLRLICFPPQITDIIRDALRRSWARGIQSERIYAGSHEFKLCGYPWHGQGQDAVPARVMMTSVLSTLYHQGWALISSTDVSKKSLDKDSLFFRYNGAVAPQPSTFFAISFNEGDKIRLINAPPDVLQAVQRLLAANVQKEIWKVPNVAYQFKLKGYPWYANGESAVTVRMMLLQLLDVLTTVGFEIYTSIDMSTGPGGDSSNAGSDTDTWILRRPNH